MRKLLRNALVTGATAAAAVALAAAPASADAGWTVDPEGSFEAVSTDSVLTNGPATLHCEEVIAWGDAFSSDPNSDEPNQVANITDSDWQDCAGPFGLQFQVTQNGEWTIHAIKVDKDDPAVVHGEIRDISASINGPLCTATVEGTVHGTYNNATGELTINEPEDGDLEVTSASCLNILAPGDKPGFTATFEVDPAFVISPA